MTKTRLSTAIGWICLFLFIITLVITLTINAYPLYVWEVTHLQLLDYVDLSKGDLLKNYRELMGYLNLPWRSALVLSDFPVSESGALHFYEVKKLFMLNYGVLFVTVIPALAFLYALAKESRLWQLVRPFQVGAMVPVIMGFLMLVGFNQFFVGFHQLFFDNDAWLFDPRTDPIINVLPQEYFMHCFVLGFTLLEVIFIIGIVVGRRQFNRK
ncbi:TIGR01906 family membrane protein [Vagococcus sp. PNs007]|uniref:TIGR01906 family membrane protein n=1 Tax=Vagococcus proximus TaxID=2991417 RepID=A0ABT5X3E7_9ENTE|nr:TIGR01906 family membrane protein [Vagococcus proximus]MDF0480531.1 TIGR01906 family membrane protein [Vagococcus proximus]